MSTNDYCCICNPEIIGPQTICPPCLKAGAYDKNGNSYTSLYVMLDDIQVGERFRQEYNRIEDLCESIRNFGLIHYPVIDMDMNLIAGGRRLTAVKKLGWKRVQVTFKRAMTEVKLREMELEENLQRENLTWQEEVNLQQEIVRLKQEIYGVKKPGKSQEGIGVSQNEIAGQLNVSTATLSQNLQLAAAMQLVPELANAKTKDDASKMLKSLLEKAMVNELETRRKDNPAFVCDEVCRAEQSFIIGDAIEGLRSTPPSNILFMNVDTPYGIDLNNSKRLNSDVQIQDQEYHEWTPEEYLKNCFDIATELYRIAAGPCTMTWWFGIQWYQPLLDILRSAQWDVDIIPCLWQSPIGQTMQPELNLARCYEPFFHCRKGKPILGKRGRSNIFSFGKVAASSKIHKTEKPLELMLEVYETFAPKHCEVLVPFLGSGVDIMTGLETGRDVRGWDLNAEIKKRFLINVNGRFKK